MKLWQGTSRLAVALLLCTAAPFALFSVARAWSKGATRRNASPLLTIPFSWGDQLQDESSPWKAAFRHGINNWNTTPTKARFKQAAARQGTAPNVLNTYHSCADKSFGVTYSYLDDKGYVHASIVMGNACYAPSVFTTPEEYKSTATHELGHAIGLGHTSVLPAVMNQARNRKQIYTAQPDDIEGVNALYP